MTLGYVTDDEKTPLARRGEPTSEGRSTHARYHGDASHVDSLVTM